LFGARVRVLVSVGWRCICVLGGTCACALGECAFAGALERQKKRNVAAKLAKRPHSTQHTLRAAAHKGRTEPRRTLGMMPGHSALARRHSATPSMRPARKPRSVAQSRPWPVRASTHAAASRRLSASVSGFMLPCRVSADAMGEPASMVLGVCFCCLLWCV
jgi:hypothetical protein